jgi:hypothetical protein
MDGINQDRKATFDFIRSDDSVTQNDIEAGGKRSGAQHSF